MYYENLSDALLNALDSNGKTLVVPPVVLKRLWNCTDIVPSDIRTLAAGWIMVLTRNEKLANRIEGGLFLRSVSKSNQTIAGLKLKWLFQKSSLFFKQKIPAYSPGFFVLM